MTLPSCACPPAPRGAPRHATDCPNSRAGIASRSGPSGRGIQPRSNVDSAKLATLRELLAQLPNDATPNQVLDAAIQQLESSRA
jgi:hypothetical protein